MTTKIRRQKQSQLQRINVFLEPEIKDKLAEISKINGLSMSAIVSAMVSGLVKENL